MGDDAARGVLLAHITDTHVTPCGRRTAVLKDKSIDILTDLVRQVKARGVDCTLLGGDNIDNRGGGTRDLEAFAETVERIDDFVCIIGNHEADTSRAGRLTKEQFAERLAGHGIEKDKFNFTKVVGNVRIIGIDTTLVGSAGGYVAPHTMRYLAGELNSAKEEHIVVLGHHLLHRAWEPHFLQPWDQEYLVANREAVITLLASNPSVRAYLCGHHHASRIQRIASRGATGGFYHVLTSSPVAYPHTARLIRFAEDGIHVATMTPELTGLVEEGKEAVITGRKAKRFALLGSRRSFLQYVEGRRSDNNIILPYDQAPEEEQLDWRFERRQAAV